MKLKWFPEMPFIIMFRNAAPNSDPLHSAQTPQVIKQTRTEESR
jgi:hypothetical protein